LGADYTFTLPLNDGSADEFLQTNGSGVLTWAAAAGTTINSNADNRVITGSGTANTLEGETTLTYDGTVLLNTGIGAREIRNHLTLTSTADSRMLVSIPASASNVAYIGFHEGAGDGTANNMGYRMGYDASANYFRIQSRDLNGSGGAGNVLEIPDGAANIKITAGNLVIGTAGKGIDFSATANSSGSMSSELLDWYEEGTFTPTIADNDLNASESQAYHTQVGRYVRIGRMVHCQITLHTSSIGSLTTSHGVKILGLPFSSLNSGATVGGGSVYIATGMSMTAGTSITVDVPSNVSYCRFQNFDASSGTSTFLLSEWGSGDYASGGNILLSLSYEAA